MASTILATKAVSISVSLVAAGGIAALSLFDIPELQAQPASRSLPSIRWLFSRGSHIFPTACFISSAGFASLAYTAMPANGRVLVQLLRLGSNSAIVNGYLAAAVLTFSIAPFTAIAMVPTNFELIQKNEEKGGARSQASAALNEGRAGGGSALQSVSGEGQPSEFSDLSIPSRRTESSTSEQEDQTVHDLLGAFGRLNAIRAVLMGAGGVIGLIAALA